MKYKLLTKEQIIISIDRLTRFKNTKEKYLRVFSDILTTCLINPKIKKTDLKNMDFSLIADMVSEIINASLGKSSKNLIINNYIKECENNVFVNDENTQKLLNNCINYAEAIKLVSEDCPVNLKWLKEIINHGSFNANEIKELRQENLLKFPIEEVLLVEGITEEILLPAFSKLLGYDFYSKGVQIIAAGGKNQVVKKYYELAEQLKIPIYVLLDKDAEGNIKQIEPKLREHDKIHLVSCGEFEDILPKSLIVKTVNSHFKNFLTISEHDLSPSIATAKILEEIFKTKGLHEFKKAEFAKLVRDNIDNLSDISSEIKAIIEEIINTKKMLDSKICS